MGVQPPIQCCIYIRVSTKESDRENGPNQKPDSQLYDLENYARDHGWIIVKTYIDRITGVSDTADRPEFSKLLKDVKSPRRGFSVILFHSISRLGRGGVLQIHRILETFTANNVRYMSFTEQYLTTLGEFGEAVIAILACMARIERNQLSARVTAGMASAKTKGKIMGRKTIPIDDEALRKLVSAKASLTDIANVFHISRATAARRLKQRGLITTGMGELETLRQSPTPI